MILAIIEKLAFSFNENTVKFIDQLFKLQNSVTRMQKTVEHNITMWSSISYVPKTVQKNNTFEPWQCTYLLASWDKKC